LGLTFIQPEEFAMTNATHAFDALMDITARPRTVFSRGEGAYLWDDSGKRYLDFIQGWAVNCLGHSPPALAQALAEQAKSLITPSPAYYNDKSLELAKALVDKSCFDQVFFANSGAEANEGAIKLARKYGSLHKGGAYEIITFEGAFHGRTLATMSASGKKAFEPLFEPKVAGFRKARLNDLASVEALVNSNTVAVMLEPIQAKPVSGLRPTSSCASSGR
jgi:acetylornithine/N-succinyldiaminopimelate aminotransferase